MAYYHDLITTKSWELLHTLKREVTFTLIGGWAVYLYTKSLKSKDIDIIVDYETLDRLRRDHTMQKNDRLKKYEIHIDGIDVDIYVPFFSDLGVPVETLHAHTAHLEGFTVPSKEVLLILKQNAWRDRRQSAKGEKDRIDILALLQSGFDVEKYKQALVEFGLNEYIDLLKELLGEATEVPELDLGAHEYARLKKAVLSALKE